MQSAEPQPVAHASQAGLTACFDGVVRSSATVIDAPHTALSTWFNGAPNAHLFESIVSLVYGNKVAPRAAAVVVAAPVANGCDTAVVQVFPTARPCNQIQADLLKDGRAVANLSGLPLTQNPAGFRHLLLPASGNGCVIVAVGLNYAKP